MSRSSGQPEWPFGKATLQKLTSKKYRQEYGYYLLEGAAAVKDALLLGGQLAGVIHDPRARLREPDRTVLDLVLERGVPTREMHQDEMGKLSDLKATPPLIAVLACTVRVDPSLPVSDSLVLALDGVADPGNVGTLLRAAAFYGIKEVWLGEGTAELYNPRVLRAAMSAHLHLRTCQPVDLVQTIQRARAAGARLHAAVLEPDNEPVAPAGEKGNIILLLGSEPHGIQQALVDLADRRVAISRLGPVDSLNVAMAGTVLLDRYTQNPGKET